VRPSMLFVYRFSAQLFARAIAVAKAASTRR
jgi:hypothetical protein